VVAELNKLKKKGNKLGQKNDVKKKKENKRQKASGDRAEAGAKSTKCDNYCFVHGAQNYPSGGSSAIGRINTHSHHQSLWLHDVIIGQQ
jgi:hypothetical protein